MSIEDCGILVVWKPDVATTFGFRLKKRFVTGGRNINPRINIKIASPISPFANPPIDARQRNIPTVQRIIVKVVFMFRFSVVKMASNGQSLAKYG